MRRTGKKAEKKNRMLSNRKQGKSGRKKAKAERKKEETDTKVDVESLKEADERKRKRASRGSQLQGRDGGRKKEIAEEAADI